MKLTSLQRDVLRTLDLSWSALPTTRFATKRENSCAHRLTEKGWVLAMSVNGGYFLFSITDKGREALATVERNTD